MAAKRKAGFDPEVDAPVVLCPDPLPYQASIPEEEIEAAIRRVQAKIAKQQTHLKKTASGSTD